MENNKKLIELYSIYLELGHKVFEEKIKKPMELYLHANSNVISMNSLNSIIANAMENSKLGEASFDENDLFSPQAWNIKNYRYICNVLVLEVISFRFCNFVFLFLVFTS